jgi:glycosyltransferase involved in cell wall biosynthesis
MEKFIFFTSLPEVGGHTTITLGIVRLVRDWFKSVLVVIKEIPGHGTSASALETLHEMGVETLVLDGSAGMPGVAQWARLLQWRRSDVFLVMGMRHLSPILACVLGARRSFYYHITHDLSPRVSASLRTYAKFFTSTGFISPATERAWLILEGRRIRTFAVTQPIDWQSKHLGGGDGSGPIRFGFIGRLNEGKGCAALVRFVETCRTPCSLRVAGSGEFAGRFRELAAGQHRVSVRFDGAFSSNERESYLTTFFAEIDYLVVPSQDDLEGIPTVILEALSAGVPAIVTRAGGMTAFDLPEFGCGETGCVQVVPKDAVDDTLSRLAAESRPDATLKEACRSYFRKQFSDEAVRSVWEHLFRG